MSGKATYWITRLPADSVKDRGFRVLFHLASIHNDQKDPRIACFPTQATLMTRSGHSNGTLNNALNELEEAGLIIRRRTTIPGTKKQRTYYILGCDFPMLDSLPDEPSEDWSPDENSNSTKLEFDRNKLQKQAEQTPILRDNKLQPSGEYNKTINKTATTSAQERASEQQQNLNSDFSEGFWADLLHTLGIAAHAPGKWWVGQKAEAHVAKWLALGLTEERILAVARKSREAHDTPPDGPKGLDEAMTRAASAPATASAPAATTTASPEDVLTFWADKIRNAPFVAASSIKVGDANEMLRRGLVTVDQLRRWSIAFTAAPAARRTAA